MNRRTFFSALGAAAVGSRVRGNAQGQQIAVSDPPHPPGHVSVQLTLDSEQIAELMATEISKGGRTFHRLQSILRP